MKFNLLASASSLAMSGIAALAIPGAAEASALCSGNFSCTTQTPTVSPFSVNGQTVVTLNDFNTAKNRNLVSVVVTESGSFATTGTVTYTGSGTGIFTFHSSGTLVLKSYGGSPANFPTITLNGNGSTESYTLAHGASASYSGANTGLGPKSKTVSTGLSAYDGTGTFTVAFTSSGGAGASGTSSFAAALNSTFYPSIEVQYEYSTYSVAAPEPASLALLGVGLSGIGVLRRRRKA